MRGFVAEDVPPELATTSRDGIRPFFFVALVTRVVQELERELASLAARVEALAAR